MKIMHQSLLLVASMLIANTAFCPPGTRIEPVDKIEVPDDVSFTKQASIGVGLGLTFGLAPVSYSPWMLGGMLVSSCVSSYCRLLGNSYYDHARFTVATTKEEEENKEKEKQSYISWGKGTHAVGYLCSGITFWLGGKSLLQLPILKNQINAIDTASSGITKAITGGRMNAAVCQKYHVGSNVIFAGSGVMLGTLYDKAAYTQKGEKLGKQVKKMLKIEDLN